MFQRSCDRVLQVVVVRLVLENYRCSHRARFLKATRALLRLFCFCLWYIVLHLHFLKRTLITLQALRFRMTSFDDLGSPPTHSRLAVRAFAPTL
jgi:hypothetical protein